MWQVQSIPSQHHSACNWKPCSVALIDNQAWSNMEVSCFITFLCNSSQMLWAALWELEKSGEVRKEMRTEVGKDLEIREASDDLMVNFLSLVRSRIQDTEAAAPVHWQIINSINIKCQIKAPKSGLLIHLIYVVNSNNHVRPLSFLSFIKWAHIPLIKNKWII